MWFKPLLWPGAERESHGEVAPVRIPSMRAGSLLEPGNVGRRIFFVAVTKIANDRE
jgi:hypothetical protein